MKTVKYKAKDYHKEQLAEQIYQTLCENIGGQYVPPETFKILVENAFSAADHFYAEVERRRTISELNDQLDELSDKETKKANRRENNDQHE